jgi:uncharacterized protein GlcG (DUF336 family)
MKLKTKLAIGLGSAVLALGAQSAYAACSDVTRAQLKTAYDLAVTDSDGHAGLGGYGLPMWASMVDEAGTVCHVYTATQGAKAGNSAWLGSRIISAQKANTANAFSLDGYAISTANLYSAVQPGGSLFGLQLSNPIDPSMAYQGAPSKFGGPNDPIKGKRIGGINVFGGGLALYKTVNGSQVKVGAIGVSGDTSCRDHGFAWRLRHHLSLEPVNGHGGITTSNYLPDGSAPTYLTGATATKGDEMIFLNPEASSDNAKYWNAWAQPACPNSTGSSIATTTNGYLTIPNNL